jgi:hypothetical protein
MGTQTISSDLTLSSTLRDEYGDTIVSQLDLPISDRSGYLTKGLVFLLRHVLGLESEAWLQLGPWIRILDELVQSQKVGGESHAYLPQLWMSVFRLLHSFDDSGQLDSMSRDILLASMRGIADEAWPRAMLNLLIKSECLPLAVGKLIKESLDPRTHSAPIVWRLLGEIAKHRPASGSTPHKKTSADIGQVTPPSSSANPAQAAPSFLKMPFSASRALMSVRDSGQPAISEHSRSLTLTHVLAQLMPIFETGVVSLEGLLYAMGEAIGVIEVLNYVRSMQDGSPGGAFACMLRVLRKGWSGLDFLTPLIQFLEQDKVTSLQKLAQLMSRWQSSPPDGITLEGTLQQSLMSQLSASTRSLLINLARGLTRSSLCATCLAILADIKTEERMLKSLVSNLDQLQVSLCTACT